MNKQNSVIELFFDEPTRHWHFEEILKSAKISRPQAAQWLDKFVKDGVIKRFKEKGKMPYYVGNYESSSYQIEKKMFMLNKLCKSGFLNHLNSLQAKTAIIFGSMSRWDWHKESDIDLFIYGNDENLKIGEYELKLNREIQLFTAKNKQELKKFGDGLLKNILKGYVVKGSFEDLGVKLCLNS